LIAIATMTAFHIGLSSGGHMVASTMAFATLCLSRLLHGFNCRSRESIFAAGVFTNPYVWYAAIIGLVLLMSVLEIKPLMEVFEVAPLAGGQLATIFGLSAMPLVLIQFAKLAFVKSSSSNNI
jgi:Cation transport ATPase